jgi:hypothetical protein
MFYRNILFLTTALISIVQVYYCQMQSIDLSFNVAWSNNGSWTYFNLTAPLSLWQNPTGNYWMALGLNSAPQMVKSFYAFKTKN